jgi:hypothetical protein
MGSKLCLHMLGVGGRLPVWVLHFLFSNISHGPGLPSGHHFTLRLKQGRIRVALFKDFPPKARALKSPLDIT